MAPSNHENKQTVYNWKVRDSATKRESLVLFQILSFRVVDENWLILLYSNNIMNIKINLILRTLINY